MSTEHNVHTLLLVFYTGILEIYVLICVSTENNCLSVENTFCARYRRYTKYTFVIESAIMCYNVESVLSCTKVLKITILST